MEECFGGIFPAFSQTAKYIAGVNEHVYNISSQVLPLPSHATPFTSFLSLEILS